MDSHADNISGPLPEPQAPAPRTQPRLIIHGGAGNITRATMTPERRRAYRAALHEIDGTARSSLETATFAVTQLEDSALFNSGHGAVFTRDGINELEASVMVSRGRAKRGVGVMGLRRVRNPVLLARRMLEHGDADLAPKATESMTAAPTATRSHVNIDAGAQGHTQIYGAAAEALATRYGLPLVDPAYFFTQARWDEHVRGLEREREAAAAANASSAGTATCSWSPDAYLPQGTCGAVALDADGVVCCATSTGGLTNKVTGRVGDTPVVGAGSWAGTWAEAGDPTADNVVGGSAAPAAAVDLSRALRRLLGDCLPVPMGLPVVSLSMSPSPSSSASSPLTTARSIGLSGTGNGDSFLRVSAAHTVAALAQYRPLAASSALAAVAGPGGLLQQSAGDRWGRTGEGEGGFIGIECAVTTPASAVATTTVRSTILQGCNCGGMFRAWVDDAGRTQVRIFREEKEGEEDDADQDHDDAQGKTRSARA